MDRSGEWWKRNRDRKREPKQGKFWCMGCDRYLIHEGERCPVCKKRAGKPRNKR